MKGSFKMKAPYPKHTPEHVAGQYLTNNNDGTYSDSDTGKKYSDPKGIVTSTVSYTHLTLPTNREV